MSLSPCAYSMTFNVSGSTLNAILNQRSQDLMAVSDGRWEIYQYQLKTFAYPLEEEQVIAINTEVELGSLLAHLSRLPRLHH